MTETATKQTCCVQVNVSSDKWRSIYQPCSRIAKVDRNGKWYCGQHDPQAIKTRRDKSLASWAANIKKAERTTRLHNAAEDLLAALKGVLRVADRQTAEFDAARAAILKAEGPTT